MPSPTLGPPRSQLTAHVRAFRQTAYVRFRRYVIGGGTLVLQQIQAHADAGGDIDWLVRIDSTILQARQHAATGRKGETSLVAREPP